MREIFMSGSARGDEAMPRRLLYRLKKDAAIAAAFFIASYATT